jgi:hypothetical protein
VPGEPDEPGDAAKSDGPVFAARAANQLFVAAIACLTAWRPLSSTPLPDPGVSPRRSSSAFSPAKPPAAEPAAAEPTPVAARKPVLGVFEFRGRPMSSAGNGTGAGPDAAAPEAREPGADEEDEPSVTPSSGTGSAPLRPTAPLAAGRDVLDVDDADRDVPDRVRDEDIVPLSSIVSALSASGSTT